MACLLLLLGFVGLDHVRSGYHDCIASQPLPSSRATEMATEPGRWDINPQRRADYPLEIQIEDSEGNKLNLTGWQILAQIWDPNRTQKIGDFTVTPINLVDGHVLLKIPYTVTAVLPFDSRYDVMLISPSGLREYYLEGLVQASEGYTSP